MEKQETSIVFVLINRFLDMVRESGATEEESLAALQSAVAILPTLALGSEKRTTVYC